MLFVFEADHFRGNVLERAQQFAATLGQQPRIGAGQFDIDFARFQPVGICCTRTCSDPVLQPEPARSGKGFKECRRSFGLQLNNPRWASLSISLPAL